MLDSDDDEFHDAMDGTMAEPFAFGEQTLLDDTLQPGSQPEAMQLLSQPRQVQKVCDALQCTCSMLCGTADGMTVIRSTLTTQSKPSVSMSSSSSRACGPSSRLHWLAYDCADVLLTLC